MAEAEKSKMGGLTSEGRVSVKKNSKKPTTRKKKKGADGPVPCQYCGWFLF